MKYLILLALILVGCDKFESSEEMYEEGIVTHMKFIPEYSTLMPSLDGDGNMTLTTVTYDAEYILEFQCKKHQSTFRVSSGQAERLWSSLNEGDSVIITYAEIDRVTYKDGEEQYRSFHDFDFITARKFTDKTPRERD